MEKTTVFECTIKVKMCEDHIRVWKEDAGLDVVKSGDSEQDYCTMCLLNPIKNLSDVKTKEQ